MKSFNINNIGIKKKRVVKARGGTVSTIAVGFIVLIAVGTALLMLPISSASGEFTSPLTALFTATSASCVTGLTVVTTATYWNTFGHIVIILLIQVGGLGFMTMAVLAAQLFRRAVTPKDQMLVAMSYNLTSYESIPQLVRRIIIGTLGIELAGACALLTQFAGMYDNFGEAVAKSIFTSISAFCNAGFDLVGENSIAPFAGNYFILITLTLLIGLGGIGFVVWNELINRVVRKKRLSAYSRFVLLMSAILLFGGALLFGIIEWKNDATIGGFSVGQKILDSVFQSITYRTAGFAIFDNAGLTQGGKLMGIIWMFIGGASGSTAGGVKVVTFGVLIYTVWCVAIGKKDTVVFGRRISESSFVRAVSVIVVQLVFLFAGTFIICMTSDAQMIDSMFETASAVSTVGLTAGLTGTLGVGGLLTDILLMYFGRVGILSVTYAVMMHLNEESSCITYPDANMLIG